MTRALAAMALLFLCSCATGPGERIASMLQPAPPGRSAAAEVVAYIDRLRPMTPQTLAREAARQRQLAAREATPLARTKAAVALLLAQHEADADILALLEPGPRKDAEDPELRSLASFLHVLAGDRRRLRESAAAKVRDERRAQEQMRSRADAAQERAAQLQQKLDALTELEKSLSDRQPSSR